MNDEQRKHLVRQLGSKPLPVNVGRLKTVYVKLENQLNAFIRLRRIDPENLPNYKVQKVFVEANCVTIITDTDHFVSVSSERDQDESVQFSTVECPNIDSAYAMGILSEEQHSSYMEAELSYVRCRDTDLLKARIKELVCVVGDEAMQAYLDELKQQEEQNDRA
jgi:hypothetical protein